MYSINIYPNCPHAYISKESTNHSKSAHRIFEELFIRISSSPPPLLKRLREVELRLEDVEKLAEERLQQVKKMDGGEVEGRRRRRRSE